MPRLAREFEGVKINESERRADRSFEKNEKKGKNGKSPLRGEEKDDDDEDGERKSARGSSRAGFKRNLNF